MKRARYSSTSSTTTTTSTSSGSTSPTPPLPTFSDSFANLNNWAVSDWSAPGGGKFSATHVDTLPGMLRLTLTQDGSTAGSVGGEVQLKQQFGYGSYRFQARMGSTSSTPDGVGHGVSGQISAVWNYGPDASYNSVTEIDGPEVEGDYPNRLSYTVWKNGLRSGYTPVNESSDIASAFHEFRFDWEAGSVKFYFDGVCVATQSVAIPTVPAYPMINFWGTNSAGWGGTATIGTRYMYVKNFSFYKSGSY